MTKRKKSNPATPRQIEPEAPATTALELDRLVQDNEELREENALLKRQLAAAKEVLAPKWAEHEKLMVVFAAEAAPRGPAQNGDLLARFRPILESARVSYGRIAQLLADLGGRATLKQLAAAGACSMSTVENAVRWLKNHGVVRKDGGEVVVEE